MIDDDIRKLVERDHRADLGALEADVWRREGLLRTRRNTTRRIAVWQGVMMAVAVAGSASAGFAVARQADPHQARLLVPGEQFAPSTLLFGAHR
ncbi:hypothetical protein SAMN02745126_00253 [Enhydrobacter aerosaccus]|uniref:Uncharacterized protein n=1 Tax=Enhydrobacter aerosaccus TaxID=225324 RepID=A0A1T4JNI8_9HYPH|nr:hypothetical protein [Enhydrobacter aerosaccus]SJZ31776.1 hypothetical protein SAMN02745126_00253 [Enhydrobacter aerosaccus]